MVLPGRAAALLLWAAATGQLDGTRAAHRPRPSAGTMTLASKIFPPPIPPWSIPRPALEAHLDAAFAHRLTSVTAGAGFGKSTLLATWGTRAGCAWYTLDASDALPTVLAGGLVEALRRRVPDLSGEISAAAGGAAANPAEERQRADALAAYLCEELERRLNADLALVIDDAHEIDSSGASAHLIESLCRNAPPRLHLVLSSRAEPPFKVERLRARGEVLSLPPATLAFSEEELGRMLTDTLGDGAARLAANLQEMTGGWPEHVGCEKPVSFERADQLLSLLREGVERGVRRRACIAGA